MLAAVLLALVGICWIKMSLPCHLHQRMNMRLRYSLHSSVEFLLLSQSLELKSWHFQIMHMIWFIVQDAGFIGMEMVVHYFQISNTIIYTVLNSVIQSEIAGGKPLMELNRILRPGGFFVWSATPVYRDDERDKKVWKGFYLWILSSPNWNSYKFLLNDQLQSECW